jgi:thiamine biosynthesis protein ThiI
MKCISLLSSGIDSPVAVYILSHKIKEIILLHVDTRPYTDDLQINNFKSIAKHLSLILTCKVDICIVPHGKALQSYKEGFFQQRFLCVFCKRMMLRYAEYIAKKKYFDFIIMGDSLGQVASQTLTNMATIDNVVTIPILRPLIGFDKEEIIDIAKRIGTYELSIRNSVGCLAVPKKPATQATIQRLTSIENQLLIEDLVDFAINNIIYL